MFYRRRSYIFTEKGDPRNGGVSHKKEGLKGISPEKNVLHITPSPFSTSKLHKG